MSKIKHITKRKLVETCSALLILLFVYAALMKVFVYYDFISQLKHSPLLEGYANILAWLVPSAEIAIAALLFIPAFRQTGFYLSFGLMLLFTLYVIYVLNYARYIPCACGGVLNNMSWPTHLIFNIIYSGIALGGLLMNKNILLVEGAVEAKKL